MTHACSTRRSSALDDAATAAQVRVETRAREEVVPQVQERGGAVELDLAGIGFIVAEHAGGQKVDALGLVGTEVEFEFRTQAVGERVRSEEHTSEIQSLMRT